MARTKGPDGAKPGAASPTAHYDRNIDETAKARESGNVTIGEIVYHRRRRTWQVTRALRELLDAQETAGGRAERARRRIDKLRDEYEDASDARADAIDEEIEALRAKVRDAVDEGDDAAFRIIALLLRRADGEEPDVERLKADLDFEDAGDLAAELAGAGEPVSGPTETATSSD